MNRNAPQSPNPYRAPAHEPADSVVMATPADEHDGISINYSLMIDDVIRWSLFRHEQSPTARRSLLISRTVFLALFIVLGAVAGMRAEQREIQIAVLVLCSVTGIGFWAVFPSRYRRRVAATVTGMYAEGTNEALFGPQLLTIAPNQVTIATSVTHTVARWSVVERIAVEDTAAYFYLSSVSAQIVPRRAFESRDKFELFVSTAKRFREQAVRVGRETSLST